MLELRLQGAACVWMTRDGSLQLTVSLLNASTALSVPPASSADLRTQIRAAWIDRLLKASRLMKHLPCLQGPCAFFYNHSC
jgi:hypothetical protein